ncbi:MAG: two-component system sensor histidine kinase NtrB [Desulfuromonadaceae bacterium]
MLAIMAIDKDKNISPAAELRRQAEELLPPEASEAGLSRTDCEMQRLRHELEVQRVELEMQNVELRIARDHAEKSLEKYSDFYDFAPVGYSTLDSSGIITSVNLRGASLVGVARERLLGRNFGLLVTDEYRAIFTQFISSVFISQDKAECEVAIQNGDNSPVIVLLEAMAAISGQECGLVLIDISERKRLEILLQQSERRYRSVVEQAQKKESIGVLAGGIAHDFNNILTIILGHCQLLSKEIDSGMTVKEHAQRIEAAGSRAVGLCRQLLTYAGQSSQVHVRVNLCLLVDGVVKMLTSAIKKNVTIEVDLDRDVPELTGDNVQIQQVVMNLIINAAEAIGDSSGTLRVTLKKILNQEEQPVTDFMGNAIPVRKYACLEVSDTGCGIDREAEKRIFEPFYSTKAVGRGLGMSAVLGIVKSHDGALQLTSSPGVGTAIRIYFPLPDKVSAIETTQAAGFVRLPGRVVLSCWWMMKRRCASSVPHW